MLDKIALTLLIIGGGQTGVVSRIIYIVVALAAIWCISLLFRDTHDTVVRDRHPRSMEG